MEQAPIEIAESLRNLLDAAESQEAQARQLGEAAARLAQASRQAAARYVAEQPPDLRTLLTAAGGCAEVARQVMATGAAIGDAIAELPIVLAPEPPTPLAARARQALTTRLGAQM